MIDISVVIPTFNREKYIKRAIDSVLDQKDQGHKYRIAEIVVVDDGSTDNTEDIISKIGDNRIIFRKMKNNYGAATARNEGVRIANGEWVAFQDSDDIWHKDKLIKQVEFLERYPNVDMVTHPIRAIFDDGQEIISKSLEVTDYVKAIAEKNEIGTPTMLVRKISFEETGGFDQRLKALEDWDFVIRFADKFSIGMLSDVLIDADMIVKGISSDASRYYESRCRMIAWNKDILLRHGCFDDAVRSLLKHADNNGILNQVSKMLGLYLQG